MSLGRVLVEQSYKAWIKSPIRKFIRPHMAYLTFCQFLYLKEEIYFSEEEEK